MKKAIVLTAAGWCIYILLLPFISSIMVKLFPAIWQCQYKRITGQQCPFCGITRDIGSFYSTGNWGFLNNNSVVCFIVLLVAAIALLLFFVLTRSVENNNKPTI